MYLKPARHARVHAQPVGKSHIYKLREETGADVSEALRSA